MLEMQSESPADGAGLWVPSIHSDRTSWNESRNLFCRGAAVIRNMPALFMPPTPFREGDVAICSGRSSGFRIIPNLLLPIEKRAPVIRDRMRRFHSGSLQIQSPITAAGPRRSPDDKPVTVFPFHSHPCCLASNLTPRNTREHLNRVVCTHAQAT